MRAPCLRPPIQRLLATVILAGSIAGGCAPTQDIELSEVGVTPDGMTLFVSGLGCDENAAVNASEGPESVTLHATEPRHFFGGQPMCDSIASVELIEPLGDRSVIDATTGSELEVSERAEP